MVKLFLFDKEKMVRDALSLICKKRDIACYVTEQVEDLGYILKDFAPDYLLCDGITVSHHLADQAELIADAFKEYPVILLGEKVETVPFSQHVPKPIDLFSLLNELEA